MLLLQRKNLKKFGGGKWNGPGGKIEPNESAIEGVCREVLEETGLRIYSPILKGVLEFYFGKKPESDWTCYIFRVEKFSGDPVNLGEGELRWFKLKDIPYKNMWEDDKHWLPLLIDNKNFKGHFIYDEKGEKIIEYNLQILHKL
jgi:8-oxo-dGTP pyrophosphatase MutT (NUDIX family)